MQTYPLYLATHPVQPNEDLLVTDKYSGEPAYRTALAGPWELEQAIAAANDAAEPMAKLPGYARREVLEHCVKRFEQRRDELSETLCIEAGKPIRDSKGEVARLIETFKLAADEAIRLPGSGRVIPMDVSARAAGYRGMTRRVPIGACSFITPFNFPLNLVAHKVAPAIAAGCPFVLKPAGLTPIGALIIGEILAETDLPEGAFSILPLEVRDAGPLIEDDRLKLLSFTGSDQVGWQLKARAGKKKVVLELGGDAAVVLDETLSANDIDDAVSRIIIGGFYQSGQSCISVQRIFAHRDIYKSFRDKLVTKASQLVAGDPRDDDTFIGPIITDAHADRIMNWVNEAVDGGAKVLCGGQRSESNNRVIQATLLENVPANATLCHEEAFGPVACLTPFGDYRDALTRVNTSRYGLQAGVFTRDIDRAMLAWDTLDVGGVTINETPSWRVDHMPYGGVKDSGLGREGLRYAIEDMTEPRLLVIRDRPVP